jgi:hypothetical protein
MTPHNTHTSSDRHRHLQSVSVDRATFFELLLGFKKLVRSDEPAAGLHGLTDPERGERYIISKHELHCSPPPFLAGTGIFALGGE